MLFAKRLVGVIFVCLVPVFAHADTGSFDIDRWYNILDEVRVRAAQEKISTSVVDATLVSPALIPSILKNDKNQSEFKMTLDAYLSRTVSQKRIKSGRNMRAKYPTMLARVNQQFGIPPHVMLAFWGLESNYGEIKARHKLTNAFLTLMYDGRRETFFKNQLIELMKIADKNKLDINNIYGSWAGAMGHFQFIPTTLSQYGIDGNGDGRVDIINSVGDAMFSAANYLHHLGWNSNERIVRRVILPADFDIGLLDGKTRKTLSEWAYLGITNVDGTPIPDVDMLAGLVADVNSIASYEISDVDMDTDVAPRPVVYAYLTYPNFYRIKKWNNSNWYAIAIATLADELK